MAPRRHALQRGFRHPVICPCRRVQASWPASGLNKACPRPSDRGIQYQQNPDRLPIPVLVLIASRTRVQELRVLIPRVVDIVTGNLQRRFYCITERDHAE